MKHPSAAARNALSRPRRIAVAVGLFLLIATVPVTFAGSSMHEISVEPQLPETFRTAEPLDGDEGWYVFTVYENAEPGAKMVQEPQEAFRFMHRFHWFPVEGVWTQLHEIGEYRDSGCNVNGAHVKGYQSDLFSLDGDRLGRGEGCDQRQEPLVTDDPAWGTRVLALHYETWRLIDDPWNDRNNRMNAEFCGHKHAFQGNDVPLQDLDEIFTRCEIHRDTRLPPPRYQALDMFAWGDEKALVVEGHIGGDRYPLHVLQWWFVPSIAYPVKVTIEPPDEDHVIVVELDRLRTGETAPARPPAALSEPQLQPWGADGPSEDGLDHPFPLEEALDRAMEDPFFSDLREYREAHPDAAVQSAKYALRENPDRERHHWDITLSDGDTSFRLSAWKEFSNLAPRPLSHHLGLHVPHPVPQYDFRAEPTNERTWFHPDDLPEAPPIAHLFAVYERIMGQQANHWGISPCRSLCTDEGPFVYVGHTADHSHARWQDDDLLMASGHESDNLRHELFFDHQGAPTDTRLRSMSDQYGPQAAPAPEEPQTFDRDFQALDARTVTVWEGVPAAVAAGSVLAALLVAITYWAWPLLKMGPAALFSRVDRHKLLDHPTRQAIHRKIETRPGIHLQELVRELDMKPGTVRHHLEKLLQGGLVVKTKEPGYTCYYVPGRTEPAQVRASVALKSPVARRLLAVIGANPELTGKEAADLLEVSPPTVQHHLKRLEQAGLIERRRTPRGQESTITKQGILLQERQADNGL